jgi:quinol-cytochrome oxidoreductase complex cytochrome b subunit
VALSLVHLTLLHLSGSTNPLGVCAKVDSIRFYPKYISKDLFGFFLVVGLLSLITVFFLPNLLGHPDNYIRADALVTPKHIVPEWYFLPFYAILRAIPNKLGGVIAMFTAIIVLFFLPFLGDFDCKSSKFVGLSQFFFWMFVLNLLLLGYLGACVVEQPFVIISQIAASFYFAYFLVIIPILSSVEKKAIKIHY